MSGGVRGRVSFADDRFAGSTSLARGRIDLAVEPLLERGDQFASSRSIAVQLERAALLVAFR